MKRMNGDKLRTDTMTVNCISGLHTWPLFRDLYLHDADRK